VSEERAKSVGADDEVVAVLANHYPPSAGQIMVGVEP
jgi:hypothetical protein